MPDAATTLIVRQAGRAELSPGMALTRLLLQHRTVAAARAALEALDDTAAPELLRFLDANRAGSEQAAAILAGADAGTQPAGIERCRRLFDWATGVSPEAGVALYSLGDPALLAEATAELVELLARLGVIGRERHLLDIGCGIGRLETALAGEVASITGVDISGAMVREAERRCRGLANVRLRQTSGHDLHELEAGAFDAVIAVDSFPYLYEAGGPELVAAHFREIDRVLRPGGDLVILNLSYRGDLALDQADARVFADRVGFTVQRDGTADLHQWDGRTFHWRKPGASRRP
jgi:SAM-dependent methyltransferase